MTQAEVAESGPPAQKRPYFNAPYLTLADCRRVGPVFQSEIEVKATFKLPSGFEGGCHGTSRGALRLGLSLSRRRPAMRSLRVTLPVSYRRVTVCECSGIAACQRSLPKLQVELLK